MLATQHPNLRSVAVGLLYADSSYEYLPRKQRMGFGGSGGGIARHTHRLSLFVGGSCQNCALLLDVCTVNP